MGLPLLLRYEDVASELNAGERVVERVIRELPLVRLGPRSRRWPADALREWIETHAEYPEAAE